MTADSAPAPAPAARAMRADARRNFDRILETATDVFAELGPDAPLDEIARRARVGAGTLYRHFPQREVLIEAVYRNEVERLCQRAYQLIDELPPAEALFGWLREQVRWVIGNNGVAMTLKAALDQDSEVFALCKTMLRDAATALMEPAKQAGALREDVTPREVLLLGHGIGVASRNCTDVEVERLISVLLAGLRPLTP